MDAPTTDKARTRTPRTVIVIGPTDGYRGTQKNLLACTRIFRSFGMRVVVFTNPGNAAGVRIDLDNERVPVVEYTNGTELRSLLESEILRNEHPVFVNVHAPGWHEPSLLPAFRFLHGHGIPIALTNVFGRNDWKSGRFVDVNVQISLWDLSRWNARRFPIGGGRFGIYLPYAIDTDGFRRTDANDRSGFRRKLGIGDKDFVVGRLGKTDWRSVERSVSSFLARHPDAHFVSVDDYNQDSSAIARLSRIHTNRVHVIPMLASTKESAVFYSACDLTIAASGIGESFGYVIAESLACETPVVSVSRPAQDNAQLELIGDPDFVAGKIADLPATLERAFRRIANEPGLGRAFREKTERRYGTVAVASMWKTFCETMERASKTGRVDRDRAREELAVSFQTSFAPGFLSILRHVKTLSWSAPTGRDTFALFWKRIPVLFYLYENLRLILKGTR